jgi:hypothetical protein
MATMRARKAAPEAPDWRPDAELPGTEVPVDDGALVVTELLEPLPLPVLLPDELEPGAEVVPLPVPVPVTEVVGLLTMAVPEVAVASKEICEDKPEPIPGDPDVSATEVVAAVVLAEPAELTLVDALWARVVEVFTDADETGVTSLQDRSNKGVVVKVLPTSPKLGLGVAGEASWRVNHQVLTLPKSVSQPTVSQ